MQKSNFVKPQREVLDISDVSKWLKSEAHHEYMSFLRRLNDSVKGIPTTSSEIKISQNVTKAIELLDTFEIWIKEFPPEDMGSQRFGNKIYKKWYNHLSMNAKNELQKLIPPSDELYPALDELMPYLMDSFGNPTRIDYGSGHEAAFIIFIFCLYKIGIFDEPSDDQAVVIKVFNRYLQLVRQLQSVYRMEPAGSRGVHAIDDFQFLPFLFGSSQLIDSNSRLIPDYYLRPEMVTQYQNHNLFFGAIQYINDTKTGPFYEHSNQLYNISAVQSWEKINEGMFKMYEGEVLKKFPVVQHFLFGSLFKINESQKKPDICAERAAGLDKIAQSRHPSSLGMIPE